MKPEDVKRLKIETVHKIYRPECFSDWLLITLFPVHLFDAVMAGFDAGSEEEA